MFRIEIPHNDIYRVFLRTICKKLKLRPHAMSSPKFTMISHRCENVIVPATGHFQCHDDINGKEEIFNVSIQEEGRPTAIYSSEDGQNITHFKRVIVSHEDWDTLQAFVHRHTTYDDVDEDNTKVGLYYSRCDTGHPIWDKFSSCYVQPLNNIFIPPRHKETVTKQIQEFIDSRKRYVQFGRPYKLSFLLTGTPGSGKTSFVKSLCHLMKRKLYVVSFSKTMTDEKLLNLMTELPDDSVLLLEDIDAFFVDRQPQDISVSFSCLLNVLDGTMAHNNGTITFLTANNPNRLDPALIRPGRVDHIITFDWPRKPEIKAAFSAITGKHDDDAEFEAFYEKIKNTRLSMSAIVDYLFRHNDTYNDHVDSLLSQTRIYDRIVNDATHKLYN
jgi:predicted AAA+ superfamily ATPase